jgi:myo-inositol catabolism protein IolC
MAGTMSEADAVAAMKDSYARVAALWDAARATARRDAA